jgi:hypothetical protein
LPHPPWAVRHPAVIAAGSRLIHAGSTAFEQAALRRYGVGKRPVRGRAQVTGLTAGALHLQTFGGKETFVARHQDIHPTFQRNFRQHNAFEQAELILRAALDPTIAKRANKGELVKGFDHFDLLQTTIN